MKKAILAVSFGTTCDETREKTIGALENEFSCAYPDRKLVRAFSSTMIVRSLAERGIYVSGTEDALISLYESGYGDILIQPTHVICGEEYEKVRSEAILFRKRFSVMKIGKPLLSSDNDISRAAELLIRYPVTAADETLVLVGHGSEHSANMAYALLQSKLDSFGGRRIILGTVEGTPDINDVVYKLKSNGCKKVLLAPLMVVAGEHAHNDMSGSNESSWKSVLENEGIQVNVLLKGLGEYPEIRQIYIEHMSEAEAV